MAATPASGDRLAPAGEVSDAPPRDDRFAAARHVADAVLYEGYVLYPYRASARKNQLRWQFGVLGPEGSGEASSMRTEVVVDGGSRTRLSVRIRGLQVQSRTVEEVHGDGFRPVSALDVGDQIWTTFEEAVEHEIDLSDAGLDDLVDAGQSVDVEWTGSREDELITGPDGAVIGRVVRRRLPVTARIRVRAHWFDGPYPLARLTIDIDNTTGWTGVGAGPPRPEDGDPRAPTTGRDEVVRRSLVAVHTLVAVDNGRFLSALDPPRFAEAAVASCTQVGTFPVLIDDTVVLSSPIILYDRPAVAPESEGDLFDATEIDEILALRVLTLTDDEKREARGTDPRSAAVMDRIEAMTPASFEALHGTFRSISPLAPDSSPGPTAAVRPPAGLGPRSAVGARSPVGTDDGLMDPERWWEPAIDASFNPWTDTVLVGAAVVAQGSRVRLCPIRRADAQDLFVVGREATVAGVFHDVDEEVHLAVVLDDDPGAELHQWHGRYLYFHLDEVEVLS
jgi:hypothetical protein